MSKGTKRPIIGLNTGAGNRFAGKRLPEASYLELIPLFNERLGATVWLLGGKDEMERNARLQKMSAYPVFNTGSHSIEVFAGIVSACDLIISGDSTAMHIAVAMKVPVVVHFGSTCPAEIELYGRGRKVVAGIDCAPCYKKICPIDEQCMKDMNPEVLFRTAWQLLKKKDR